MKITVITPNYNGGRWLARGMDSVLAQELAPGDELLIASSLAARRDLELTLHNPNELDYVLTGHELTGSWVSHWFAARRKTIGHRAGG